jgi:hypothetical protein
MEAFKAQWMQRRGWEHPWIRRPEHEGQKRGRALSHDAASKFLCNAS